MHPISKCGTRFKIDTEWDKEEPYEKRCIHNLLEAILERAWRDALGTAEIDSSVLIEARQWFHNTKMDEWSFLWVAEELLLTSTIIKRIRSLIPQYSRQPLIRSDSGFVVQVSADTIVAVS